MTPSLPNPQNSRTRSTFPTSRLRPRGQPQGGAKVYHLGGSGTDAWTDRGGGEAEREALLAGGQAETEGDVGCRCRWGEAMTFSRRSIHSQRASSSTCILFRLGIALNSKLSRHLTVGKGAA